MSAPTPRSTTTMPTAHPSEVSKDSHGLNKPPTGVIGRKRAAEGVTVTSRSPKKMKKKVEQFVEKTLSSDDEGGAAAQIEKMEKHRRRQNRAFLSLLRKLRVSYRKVASFQSSFMSGSDNECEETLAQRRLAFNSIMEELVPFLGTSDKPKFKWREQARGPTGTRSAKVEMNGEVWSNDPIWVLYTPPKARTIQTEGRTLNEDRGPFLTWGLPDKERLDRNIFKQARPVFVIEKFKGGNRVQHRIKGVYVCLTNARKRDNKLFLVKWEHFVEQIVFQRTKLDPPSWCKRPKKE